MPSAPPSLPPFLPPLLPAASSLPVVTHRVTFVHPGALRRRQHLKALFERPEVICLSNYVEKPQGDLVEHGPDPDEVWIRESDGKIRGLTAEDILYPEKSGIPVSLARAAALAVLETQAFRNWVSLDILDAGITELGDEDGTALVFQMRNALIVLKSDSNDEAYQMLRSTTSPDRMLDRENYLAQWEERLEIGAFFLPEPSSAHEHLLLSQAIKQEHADFLELAPHELRSFQEIVDLRLPDLPRP